MDYRFPEPANEAERLLYGAIAREMRGELDEAEALLKQALAAGEELLGSEHLTVADILLSLGALYLDRQAYDEAEAHVARALAIQERSLGPEDPRVAGTLRELGKVRHRRGRLAEAEILYQRALALYERGLGPDAPRTAAVKHSLASLYRQQGRHPEADALTQQAQATIGHWIAPMFGSMETALQDLTRSMAELGPSDCAGIEPQVRRSIALTEHMVGPDHPSVASLLDQLALLLRKMERPSEAAAAEQRARDIRQKNSPGEAPEL